MLFASRVFAKCQILLGFHKKCYFMKPTNFPTQGQPNPRKIMDKGGIWATFCPRQIISHELGLILYRKHTTRNPNPTKFSANTLQWLMHRQSYEYYMKPRNFATQGQPLGKITGAFPTVASRVLLISITVRTHPYPQQQVGPPRVTDIAVIATRFTTFFLRSSPKRGKLESTRT